MFEASHGLHFALKTGNRLSVDHAVSLQNLKSDDAIELFVPGLIDRAHAALARLLDQLILAQATRRGTVTGCHEAYPARGAIAIDGNSW